MQVAVKVLKETGAVALGDFRTELNVLQKVHHPHTVRAPRCLCACCFRVSARCFCVCVCA